MPNFSVFCTYFSKFNGLRKVAFAVVYGESSGLQTLDVNSQICKTYGRNVVYGTFVNVTDSVKINERFNYVSVT